MDSSSLTDLQQLSSTEYAQLERESRAIGHLLAVTLRDSLAHYEAIWLGLAGAEATTLVQLQANALEESLRLVRINRAAEPYLAAFDHFTLDREQAETARDVARDLSYACIALLELHVSDQRRNQAVEAVVPPPSFFTTRLSSHSLAVWLDLRERDHV